MSAFFYQHETGGDVLFLVIEPSAYPDRTEKRGDVVALYKGDSLVGVNFLEFGKKVKVKASGLIVAPNDAFIDVVNAELENAGLAKLDYVRSSGYKVGTIVSEEEHPLDERAKIIEVSLGEGKVSTVTRYQNACVGTKIVVAVDGTIKFDGTKFSSYVSKNIPVEAEVCCEKDLRIGEEYKKAFVPEGYEDGADFFVDVA